MKYFASSSIDDGAATGRFPSVRLTLLLRWRALAPVVDLRGRREQGLGHAVEIFLGGSVALK
jgi:hypothetical protein